MPCKSNISGLAKVWRVEREASAVSLWCLCDASTANGSQPNKAQSAMAMNDSQHDNVIVEITGASAQLSPAGCSV